jgi:hypothetical protein
VTKFNNCNHSELRGEKHHWFFNTFSMSSKIVHTTLCKTILHPQILCQTSHTPFFQPQDFCYRKENRLAAKRFFEPMRQFGPPNVHNQLVQIWQTWQVFFSNVRHVCLFGIALVQDV